MILQLMQWEERLLKIYYQKYLMVKVLLYVAMQEEI